MSTQINQTINTTTTSSRQTKVASSAAAVGSDYDDSLSAVYSYKSHIAPRSTTISRRQGGPGRTIVQTVYSGQGLNQHQGGFFMGGGVPLKPKNAAVVAIAENREKEKRELSQLNDKFASYVERVRFLEVHNKKLQMELEALKNRAGGESGKIREMYEIELREAKHLIDETSKDKANAELKARTCEDDAERFRKRYNDVLNNRNADKARIDDLNKQIADNEAEINLLKRRLGDLEDEAKRYKVETQRLLGEIQRITAELDTETLQRVQLENEKNGLEEELSFLRQMHAQELEDLRQKSFLDVGLDSSQFFKSELANAIREIRNEYEQINSNQRQEMEQWYRMKIQEVQTRGRPEAADTVIAREETRKLRSAVSDQRREIANMKARNAELDARIKEIEELLLAEQKDGQALIDEKEAEIKELRRRQAELLNDYDELTKMKTTLEEEIHTYRRLLEGEGEKEGLKQVVEGIEERARQQMYTTGNNQQGGGQGGSAAGGGGSTSYSFSIQQSSGGGRYQSGNTVVSAAQRGSSAHNASQQSGGSSVTKLKYSY
jgi:intermediate filament protein if